jgi:hypothetical protein
MILMLYLQLFLLRISVEDNDFAAYIYTLIAERHNL